MRIFFQPSPTPRSSTPTQSGTFTTISIDDFGEMDDDPLLHENENEDEEINENSQQSAKMPLKVTTSRKRQAEEEFNLIKGLTSAIQEKAKKKPDMSSDKSRRNSAYGQYIAETLSDLQPRECAVAQHKINEIIFQAQAGMFSSQNSAATHSQSLASNYNNWVSQQIYNNDHGCYSQEHPAIDSTRLYAL